MVERVKHRRARHYGKHVAHQDHGFQLYPPGSPAASDDDYGLHSAEGNVQQRRLEFVEPKAGDDKRAEDACHR